MPGITTVEGDAVTAARARAVAAWGCGIALFAVPVVLRSLAIDVQSPAATGRAESGAAVLVMASIGLMAAAAAVLAFSWQAIVRRIGNSGLATIAMIAGLQFTVAYAFQLVGAVLGTLVGPYYLFVDGIGSKGLSCLLLGVLITLLPRPGVLTLELVTVFVLNAITSGLFGLVSLLFIGVTVAVHEGLLALVGITTPPSPSWRGQGEGDNEATLQWQSEEAARAVAKASAAAFRWAPSPHPVPEYRDHLLPGGEGQHVLPLPPGEGRDEGHKQATSHWPFALRIGLAIGCAQAIALYAQYAMYEVLLRTYYDLWFKLAVSIVTGLVYGGIGATCGAMLGFRLRRTAP